MGGRAGWYLLIGGKHFTNTDRNDDGIDNEVKCDTPGHSFL